MNKIPPDGRWVFERYDHSFRRGSLCLPRKREDGGDEYVEVPAQHALFFHMNIRGAETASIGLASHPPVVIHHEDVIEKGPNGGITKHLGKGAPIEFPTRRRGYFSWHSFCKTQYAGNPKYGGEQNFLKAHLGLIELLDKIDDLGVAVRVRDDSKYFKHRDVNRLLSSLREWNGLVASVVGRISDVLSQHSTGKSVVAPIKDRPDFEHLEAKGMEVLRKMAERQKRRKGK
ncbi:MAG: hypothetical protein QM703_18955 [Gemmatales bacterium]